MSSLRDSYSRITGIYPGLGGGWTYYADDQYTSASPFVVGAGLSADLPNNAATVINAHAPVGQSVMYDGTRILAAKEGDAYSVRVNFNVESPVIDGSFSLSMDISAAGDGSELIYADAEKLVRGLGNDEMFSATFSIYSLSTFLANGGLMRLESVDGSISVFDISYFIVKLYSAN